MPAPLLTQQTLRPSFKQEQLAFWEETTGQRSPYHPVCRFFTRQRWNIVSRVVPLQQVSSVFDLGCGRGMALASFEQSGRRLAGIDFAYNQLRDNPVAGMDRLVAPGDAVPIVSDMFDLVTCWEVLHHVDSPAAVIAEMARLSREWIVIFEPNILNPAQLLFSLLVKEERKSLTLSRRLIERSLGQAGFKVVHFRRGGWIFPNRCPLWLFRLLRVLPFTLPIVGISRLWIARRAEVVSHA
jgi:SAM-dependent methyltransferase